MGTSRKTTAQLGTQDLVDDSRVAAVSIQYVDASPAVQSKKARLDHRMEDTRARMEQVTRVATQCANKQAKRQTCKPPVVHLGLT